MDREFFSIYFPLGPSKAGNLQKKFLSKMLVDSGMVFVLVLHFAPTDKSLMSDLLMNTQRWMFTMKGHYL